jgi:hypothetical protein
LPLRRYRNGNAMPHPFPIAPQTSYSSETFVSDSTRGFGMKHVLPGTTGPHGRKVRLSQKVEIYLLNA